MSALTGARVLGASLGSSGVRSVISDDARPGSALEVHKPVTSEPAPNGLAPDPWDTVITSVHDLSDEYASGDFYSVLALRESDPRTAYDQDFSDGVVLVSELGAQLVALRETGVLAGEHCVALFDVGASGTSVTVVEVDGGRVIASRRTEELGGDVCDRMLGDHLIGMFGAAEALTVDARRRLVSDVRAGKHQLSLLRSVSILGPFVGGRASLWRHDLDELIGDAVERAVSMAAEVLDGVRAQGIHVDALVAVGGGANMQIVRQVLFAEVPMPVYVPEQPELLAARGAAEIARRVGLRPVSMAPDAHTDRFAAVGVGSAEHDPAAASPAGAPVSTRPRHSGTSSKRMARASKSRHLGRAFAALVVICAAGTVVSAAARTTGDDSVPSESSSIQSSMTGGYQSVVPAVGGSAADPGGSSLPVSTTTAPTSSSVDSPTSESSPQATTATEAPGSSTPRQTITPTEPPSGTDDSTVRARPTSERNTTAATTEPRTTTTRAPSATTSNQTTTSIQTTTTPSKTTTAPTPSPTTTRPTRAFDVPLPKVEMPRR